MNATCKSVKEMADRLISTLSTAMPSEKADAIVRDVAEELYNDVLGVKGRIVVNQQAPHGFVHGSFGKGKRVMTFAEYKFEPEAKQ